jgi:phage FluMu protein Com
MTASGPLTPSHRPDFSGVANRREFFTEADLAAISLASHALHQREAISMTGAVIIAAAVLAGVGAAALVCAWLGFDLDSPVAWILLALPVLLVASIVYASWRSTAARNEHAVRLLLDACLCGSCAAPLPATPRVDRAVCTQCNASWTLAPNASRSAPITNPPRDPTGSNLSHLASLYAWQRDAMGVRVPVAVAFADAILRGSDDDSLRGRRHGALVSIARGVKNTRAILITGAIATLASGAVLIFSTGMLTGAATAAFLASLVALMIGIASTHTATRDARLKMLGARLCPCCAEDLTAHGAPDWNGQPMVRCLRCQSLWYLSTTGSIFVPQPGRKHCRSCGYALAGLSPDALAMVTCPECARRCPLPGHAACAVCDTALLVDAKQLYRGTVCPKCHTLNRIGSKGIEYD